MNIEEESVMAAIRLKYTQDNFYQDFELSINSHAKGAQPLDFFEEYLKVTEFTIDSNTVFIYDFTPIKNKENSNPNR